MTVKCFAFKIKGLLDISIMHTTYVLIRQNQHLSNAHCRRRHLELQFANHLTISTGPMNDETTEPSSCPPFRPIMNQAHTAGEPLPITPTATQPNPKAR
ncbi:hypothetical protein AVEN_212901-1, partial [Araneus ventricosus]